MKNRYWIAGLCLLVLMLCLVSACGGGGGSTTTTSSGQTTTSQATTTSAGGGGSLSDILGKWSSTNSVKYDMIMTIPGSPSITAKIWQKNKKMREDITAQGMTMTMLFDMDAGVMYTIMPPPLNTAMKSTFNTSDMPEGGVDTGDIMDYNPNIVGTETIDGKSCTVIAYEYAGSSMKYWIWTEKGFPVKMEITSAGSKTTIEYKNIDFSNIADSIFELPAGVTITQM